MGSEIFVNGDIEKGILKLRRDFQKNISRVLKSHEFFESKSQRKRAKRARAIRKLKKLESRSAARTSYALGRFSHDKRQTRLGS
jgi:ribosomal protein S21